MSTPLKLPETTSFAIDLANFFRFFFVRTNEENYQTEEGCPTKKGDSISQPSTLFTLSAIIEQSQCIRCEDVTHICRPSPSADGQESRSTLVHFGQGRIQDQLRST